MFLTSINFHLSNFLKEEILYQIHMKEEKEEEEEKEKIFELIYNGNNLKKIKEIKEEGIEEYLIILTRYYLYDEEKKYLFEILQKYNKVEIIIEHENIKDWKKYKKDLNNEMIENNKNNINNEIENKNKNNNFKSKYLENLNKDILYEYENGTIDIKLK
jgi:hypothetical protein